ncbi:MAG: o-succinylbenzoate synthase [Sphingobacteriales bacterium]|nr:MAG: o-succinylbenzoate synthase [Sphingobacteriales bacterium]
MDNLRYFASFEKYVLQFKKPAGTSRGYLTEKPGWFLYIEDRENGFRGVGECSIIPELSPDDIPDLEAYIRNSCEDFNRSQSLTIPVFDKPLPALNFAWEMALCDLQNGGKQIYFESDFTRGTKIILINGLIWMGSKQEMLQHVENKIRDNFHCIKLKIGSLNFEEEIDILKAIREFYGYDLEIRLDANGAFSISDATEKLLQLSEYKIHSIEQPIKQTQTNAMAELCRNSPIPIALDEELISIYDYDEKCFLLEKIKPQYIILKPSLLGGFEAADEWIKIAVKLNIAWWATSALESNIGLNAIAQWVGAKNITMPQGLGTGSLYVNNLASPLFLEGENLKYKA